MNTTNPAITKKLESFLFDFFVDCPEPFHLKEIVQTVKEKLSSEYQVKWENYVVWTLDLFHCNNLIKRVAPGTYESVDGPDDVYSERETGHVGEGEYVRRSVNFKGGIGKSYTKKLFNQELEKCEMAVSLLKVNHDKDWIKVSLLKADFHPVAVKLSLRGI